MSAVPFTNDFRCGSKSSVEFYQDRPSHDQTELACVVYSIRNSNSTSELLNFRDYT